MRKLLRTVFFSLAALAMTVTCAAAAGKSYINGIDANYPPFAYVDKNGKPTGFDVDAMNWIAKKMGFTLSHKPMEWNGIIPDLLAKKIDMVCSGMSITPERAERVAFSAPYYTMKKVLVAGAKSALTENDILNGKKKLGIQRGTNEAEWLDKNREKNNWNYEIRYYDSAPMAIEDLVNGRIDAAGCDAAPAEDAINKAKKPVKIIGGFGPRDEFGVAVRKEDTALRELIDKGFQLLQADPYWEELKEKYLTGAEN
ncbi:amino acid ABC transporter substrate-binding protein [Deltaproteobacteria bacterium]|nr:amino acid ABC transporter substrate-binding protein [Deltaproteobacteria bacterium]